MNAIAVIHHERLWCLLTRPLPILEKVAMPAGVGADVMLPVGDVVMGAFVAPGVLGEPVPL